MGAVIYTSKLNSLKRFKDDASEVRTGFECGAGIANFNDVKSATSWSASTCRSFPRRKLRLSLGPRRKKIG